jgi:hypothetical protein
MPEKAAETDGEVCDTGEVEPAGRALRPGSGVFRKDWEEMFIFFLLD